MHRLLLEVLLSTIQGQKCASIFLVCYCNKNYWQNLWPLLYLTQVVKATGRKHESETHWGIFRGVYKVTVIFTTWWDSPAKRCQIIFFKMFVKKVFQLVKPFLANLHYTISKKYLYMYSMTTKFFYFFFNIWVSKKRRILRWFQIRGNNLKKAYLEKVICQKLLQVSRREEYKLQFCTLLMPVTFLLANLLHFSQQFRNSEFFGYP